MNDIVETWIENTLKHEGYYNSKKDVFDLKDGAGWTHRSGITQGALSDHLGRKATYQDMEAIDMDTIRSIMVKDYFKASEAHRVPRGGAIVVADMGYNAGPRRAIKLMQKVAGTTADGAFGPQSEQALGNYIHENGVAGFIKAYTEERLAFYQRLSQWDKFGKGWTRRAEETMELALEFA